MDEQRAAQAGNAFWPFEWAAEINARTDVRPVAARVAFVLAKHMNSRTGACFPSEATIAAESGQTTRSVRRGIDGLRKIGAITVTRASRTTTNHYSLHSPTTGQPGPVERQDNAGAPTGQTECVRQDHAVLHNYEGTTKELKKEDHDDSLADDGPVFSSSTSDEDASAGTSHDEVEDLVESHSWAVEVLTGKRAEHTPKAFEGARRLIEYSGGDRNVIVDCFRWACAESAYYRSRVIRLDWFADSWDQIAANGRDLQRLECPRCFEIGLLAADVDENGLCPRCRDGDHQREIDALDRLVGAEMELEPIADRARQAALAEG